MKYSHIYFTTREAEMEGINMDRLLAAISTILSKRQGANIKVEVKDEKK